MDLLNRQQRSALMARIKGKNTKPELRVRSALHKAGYRFRLHSKQLPGRPDLVFPGRRKAIFVHGCFWHAHANCHLATTPKTNRSYWQLKLEENKKRDIRKTALLRHQGWKVLTVWQCEISHMERTFNKLIRFLEKS